MVSCTISGVEFPYVICDTRSGVSIVSKDTVEKLELVIEVPKFKRILEDFSNKSPLGVVNNLEVKVGNCMVFIDFYVLEMGNSSIHLFFWKIDF